jgi:hypothetical protein
MIGFTDILFYNHYYSQSSADSSSLTAEDSLHSLSKTGSNWESELFYDRRSVGQSILE